TALSQNISPSNTVLFSSIVSSISVPVTSTGSGTPVTTGLPSTAGDISALGTSSSHILSAFLNLTPSFMHYERGSPSVELCKIFQSSGKVILDEFVFGRDQMWNWVR